jgi:hypothetical protein
MLAMLGENRFIIRQKNACRNILNSFQDGDEATIISLADLSNLIIL